MALIFLRAHPGFLLRNSESLWTHTLACTSDNVIGHNQPRPALFKKTAMWTKRSPVPKRCCKSKTRQRWKPTTTWASRCSERAVWTKRLFITKGPLQINPDSAEATTTWATRCSKRGKVDEAIVHYQRARWQINPDSAEASTFNLGDALFKMGSVDESDPAFPKRRCKSSPTPGKPDNLAWLLATSPDAHIRDGVQAVTYAERACELTHYGLIPVVGTLAAAYAEAGPL